VLQVLGTYTPVACPAQHDQGPYQGDCMHSSSRTAIYPWLLRISHGMCCAHGGMHDRPRRNCSRRAAREGDKQQAQVQSFWN